MCMLLATLLKAVDCVVHLIVPTPHEKHVAKSQADAAKWDGSLVDYLMGTNPQPTRYGRVVDGGGGGGVGSSPANTSTSDVISNATAQSSHRDCSLVMGR